VWIWLPSATEPVVAGRLDVDGPQLLFTYGASYLQRPDAIALYLPELPLRRGTIPPPVGLTAASCLRDAGPDAWGQRVILARRTGRLTAASDTDELPLLTYLRESGSDRIGGLDFQDSPTTYKPRTTTAPLEQLLGAAEKLIAGETITGDLADALLHGTSIGGARPKVVVREEPADGQPREMIAKFSVASDPYPVIKAEAVAMNLARRVGLDIAGTRSCEVTGRDVLLVDRFDRPGCVGSAPGTPGERRLVVSMLTILGGDEMGVRHLGYPDVADRVRQRFTAPVSTLRELFGRIVFNVLVSNTDDHARNHAAFWGGEALALTPAYDLCPQSRSGDTATQAMAIDRDGRKAARLGLCVASSEYYLLSRSEAQAIVDHQVQVITEQWSDAAEEARLTRNDRAMLWGNQILNPAVHYDDWT
jgi:serine/threonine-protein kinase HipA